jgi:hypothetical protein
MLLARLVFPQGFTIIRPLSNGRVVNPPTQAMRPLNHP